MTVIVTDSYAKWIYAFFIFLRQKYVYYIFITLRITGSFCDPKLAILQLTGFFNYFPAWNVIIVVEQLRFISFSLSEFVKLSEIYQEMYIPLSLLLFTLLAQGQCRHLKCHG